MADNIQERAKTSAQSAEKAVDKVKVNRSLAKPIPKGLQDMEGGPGPSQGTGAMKPPFKMADGLQNMETHLGPSEGVGSNPSVRLVVDSAGKASYINPATGEATEVPGGFQKLVDIFHQLAGNAKEVAGNTANKAKGLLTDTSTEAEKTMKAAKGFSKDLGKGAMKAAGKDALSRALPYARVGGGAVGAFLTLMDSTEANAGEDEKLAENSRNKTPQGMRAPGNLDPYNRPVLNNPDGSVSTTSSIGVGSDKGEIVIPTVVNGKRLSTDEAIAHWKKTGGNFGTFATPEQGDAFATDLHNKQAQSMGLGEDLDNQSQAVLDKGINTATKPTMEPDAGPNPRPKTDVGAAMPQAATMVDNHTGRLGQDTKGGFFPVYDKNSGEASDFRSSFAKAIASGLPTFQWQGREYTTEIKKDPSQAGGPV